MNAPFLKCLAVSVVLAGSGLNLFAASAKTPTVSFGRDILPILSDNCFRCHGPDAKERKAQLRLDTQDGAYGPGKSGKHAVVPGDAAKSELIRRITSTDDEERMPHRDAKRQLSKEQIELLKRWVQQGAKWGQHWAFEAPERPEIPAVKNSKWARTPVDNFVLAKLQDEKLKPSSEADKVTLLRRLSLDLIGLPPTIEEVDTFLADKSRDAYEKQVDRLLKSPHYGERWGRLWLDAARYADSDGYEKDKRRLVYFYRDYVINAFNRDLPYDRFIIEQLAGDELPNATQDQVVATGFLRNSMLNEEGGVHPEQFRMEAMFDRMDAVGKGILGITTLCAQCHNHKYDPLTQEEYYRMFAFLNNDHEAMPQVYNAMEQEKIAALRRDMRAVEESLKKQMPDWRARMAKWEAEVSRDQPEWTVLRDLELISDNSQRYYPQDDGSLLAAGWAPTKFTAIFQTTNSLTNISAIRLELFTDANLPANGPGRSYKGLFALTEFNVEAAPVSDPKKKAKVKFASATADFDQPEMPLEIGFHDGSTNKRVTGPVSFAIDGDKKTAWGIDAGPGRRNTDRVAVFQLATNISNAGGSVLTFNLGQEHGSQNANDFGTQNMGRFRISVIGSEKPVVADKIPKKVREIFAIPTAKRTPEQIATVFSYWRATVPEFASGNAKLGALWQQWPDGTTAYALAPRTEPRMTAVLKRGDWLKPGSEVKPGVPAFLNPLPASANDSRLTFAKWLVDRKAPTTARVFVNRVWQAYFGTGIVETAEDFGRQAAKPSHPELLDWLASEFMDHGWSVKHLHELIVNSATYRQSSRVTPELLTKDPYNRLLARGPRFRVEAEIVRDVALSASGLLNPKIGGRSVMPPAPEYLFKPPASYGDFPWVSEKDDEKYRRALYTFRRRSTPFPALLVFDAPVGDFACVRRQRSNTPLQALTTLNEPMFMEAAQALALRALRDGGSSDRDRVNFAFRRCTARVPTKDEQKDLLSLLAKQEQRFTGKDADAWKLAAPDAANPPKLPTGATPAKLAAWTAVSRVILNLDETITKE